MKPNQNRVEQFFSTEYKKLTNYVQKNMEKRYAVASPEDIVQDVALSLLDKLNIDAQIENIAAYIYRSLRNRIFDSQKKVRNSVPLDNNAAAFNEVADNEVVDVVNDSLLGHINPEMLREAINKLAEDDRFIINETHFGGRSFQDISAELKTPVGTLLSRKHRAQAKLAKILLNKNLVLT